MNKALLSELGLGDREIATYQIVVKYKKVTPAFVAMHTKITRPTVYNICKKLVAQGLIVEDLGGKTISFLPTPPEELRGLIKKR